MASNELEPEASAVWSYALLLSPIALCGRVSIGSTWFSEDPHLAQALLALAAASALIGLGLAGAMGEPLPADPRGGRVPLRLRFCWGILGWCPPPGGLVRTCLAVAAGLVYLLPFEASNVFSFVAASAVALSAALLNQSKSSPSMDGYDSLLLCGMGAVAFGALVTTCGDDVIQAWLSVAALAALVLLAGQRAREVCAHRWAALLPQTPPPPALDLSRYEVSVARRPAGTRTALPEGVEAQLVDSGSFKVDPAKMLDKLRERQLADPQDFVCAWLRCAAASGAKAIGLKTGWTTLELRFDGRPFSPTELSQPYQALVDDVGEDSRRGRHFAYGLLALYRLKPSGVSVTSRGPDGVAAMNAGAGKPPDPAEAPDGTVVRVSWPAWAFFWRPRLLAERARQRFGLGAAKLTVDGKEVPGRNLDPSWRAFRQDGWRGDVAYRHRGSRVRLYVLGTFIEEVEGESPAPADAWLAHDDLELDISQSSVVRDRLLAEGFKVLETQVR